MSVTIKDIARRTGKSITTVSRALNGYADVSLETRELVERVALEMGYTPNRLAQRLQKRRSDTLGFILPTWGPRFSDPFFSEFLAGVGNKAAEYGYDLLVSTRPPGERELEAYRQMVSGRQVDGFLIVRTRRQDARIDYLRHTDVPFAVFGRTEGAMDFPYVDEDGACGMRLVVEHLLQYGYRRFACIAPPLELMFAGERLRGVCEGLAAAGLALDPDMLAVGDLTQRGGFEQAAKLLDHPQPPQAIIACNDLMALGAISAAQHRGLEVGLDVAITGFDDIPMAEHTHPPLTTVRQPIYLIGGMLGEMLIRRVQESTLPVESVILTPTLAVRRSCGSRSL